MPNQPRILCPKCGKENPPQNVFCGICGSRLEASSSSGGITLDDLTEAKFLERALSGKFRIEKELGRGGFGVVFQALDLLLDRNVAIKALHLTKSGDQQLVRRFIKEARLSAKLEHPNIVRIYTIDSAGLIHYFIMEFVDGPTIKDHLNERGVFSPYDAVKYAKDILNALAFAHDHGIVHRDIKPANVILKREEFAVVTDFGIAKALWSDATALTTGVIGTPIYMAPELFRGEDSDGRTDQYSLGVMLFEMLTGEPPFIAQGTLLIQQHIAGQIPSVRQRNPDVPPEIEEIVTRMLRKRREDRFKDCHEILVALESIDVSMLPRETDLLTQSVTLADFSIGNLVERGQSAMDERDYDKALEFINAAHILSPDNLDIQIQLEQIRLKKESDQKVEDLVREGIARFHEGRYTLAIQSWELALALDESHADVPKYIDQAKKLKIATDRGEALKAEGLRAVNQQRFDTAIHKFEAARELLEDDKELPDLIERARHAGKEADEVRDLLDKADEFRVNYRFEDAIAVYRRILKLDPDRVTARQSLEKTIQDQKTYADFLTMEAKWRRLATQGQFHAALIEIEAMTPKFVEFQGAIKKVTLDIKRDQEKQATIVRLAALARDFEMKGKKEEADDVWNKIRTVEPNHPVLSNRPAAIVEISQPASETRLEHQEPVHASFSVETPGTKGKNHLWIWIMAMIIISGTGLWIWLSVLSKSENVQPLTKTTHLNTAITTQATILPLNTNTPSPIQTVDPDGSNRTHLSISTTIDSSPSPSETPTPAPTIPYSPTPTVTPQHTLASVSTRPSKPTSIPTAKPSSDDSDGFAELDNSRVIHTVENLVTQKKYRRAMRGIAIILGRDARNETALQLRLEVMDILERADGLAEVARRMIAQNEMREARDIIEKLAELDPYYPGLNELQRSSGASSEKH